MKLNFSHRKKKTVNKKTEEKTVNRIGENLGQLCFREGATIQNFQGTAENKYQANETANQHMSCVKEQFLEEEIKIANNYFFKFV